jgi:uncharacterized protein YjbJ (UPF0337 family)
MGIGDKVSGRVKQAAGDLTGNASLRREGAREERKGEAKEELRRDQQAAERKAAEVTSLEHATDPDALVRDFTRDELYARAERLDVEGRSDMNKEELAEAITKRQ